MAYGCGRDSQTSQTPMEIGTDGANETVIEMESLSPSS